MQKLINIIINSILFIIMMKDEYTD